MKEELLRASDARNRLEQIYGQQDVDEFIAKLNNDIKEACKIGKRTVKLSIPVDMTEAMRGAILYKIAGAGYNTGFETNEIGEPNTIICSW